MKLLRANYYYPQNIQDKYPEAFHPKIFRLDTLFLKTLSWHIFQVPKKMIVHRSKSRIRRLSEHIRKETCQSAGQGDIAVKKNFYTSSDDVRRETSKEDQATTKHQGSLIPPAHHHYNQSLINGSFRNIPPGQAKSCLYLSQQQQQQQQLSKSQRSIQSDQVNTVSLYFAWKLDFQVYSGGLFA